MAVQQRPEPALHWPNSIEGQLKRGRDIKIAVDANGGGIDTTALTTANGEAQTAEDDMATKAPGTTETRDGKFATMKLQCELLMDMVYEASLTMDYAAAAAFILACGFYLKGTRAITNKELFEARNGEVSGTVELIAKASTESRQAHEWQYSFDRLGTWISLTPTLNASTQMTGLEPGKKIYFRHRIILKDGPTDWHEDSIIVL